MIFEDFLNFNIEETTIRLLLSLVLLILLIGLVKWSDIQMEKMMFYSYLRGLVQISLMGSIIVVIFSLENL